MKVERTQWRIIRMIRRNGGFMGSATSGQWCVKEAGGKRALFRFVVV